MNLKGAFIRAFRKGYLYSTELIAGICVWLKYDIYNDSREDHLAGYYLGMEIR